MFEILIENNGKVYIPIIEDGVKLEIERKGMPSKLTFTVLKDITIDFTEGNSVSFIVNGIKVFYGFVFTKKRDKNCLISVTAYDQLRYFKNQDTYQYSNKTADEVIKMLANDFELSVGTLENTGFKIPSRIEDNKTLFDIVQTALDLTLQNTKNLYVLYDDFGKLTLKNVNSMKLDLLIDEETGENFEYTSTIDGDTYNKIKLVFDNAETGKRELYIVQDGENINKWGVLQYFEVIDNAEIGKAKAEALLSLYNQKTRNLTINECFGDIRVRAGSSVVIKLNLGDLLVSNYMMVEKVKHTFSGDDHRMNLVLRGGEFIG